MRPWAELSALRCSLRAVAEFGQFAFKHPGCGAGFGDRFFLGRKLHFQLGVAHFKAADRGEQFVALGGEFDEFLVAEVGVEHAGVGGERLIAAGLGDLAFERVHPAFLFGEHVGDAQQVGLGVFEFAQRFLFLALELGDAGGLLEHRAAFFRLGRKDLVDLALRHDRVGGAADAGVHQHVVDVLEAAERAVDPVFRAAVAENPAGDGHFVEIDFERFLAIGHRQGDFGHAQRLAFFRAVENDVGHFAAAQGLGGGFAEHPADGIDHVGLAAAVRADDAGHAFGEFKDGLVREGLEAVEFESFEIHADRRVGVAPEREVGVPNLSRLARHTQWLSGNCAGYGG